MRRDRQRAIDAYGWARAARTAGHLPDYETAVQAFAAALLRSGLAVAVSVLERDCKDNLAAQQLRANLAKAVAITLPANQGDITASAWPGAVRALSDLATYRRMTREIVALLAWLRLACRAAQDEDSKQ